MKEMDGEQGGHLAQASELINKYLNTDVPVGVSIHETLKKYWASFSDIYSFLLRTDPPN